MSSTALISLFSVSLLVANAGAQKSPTTAAIDAEVWAPISASVVNDDIAAMVRLYHPDAILVTETGTRRIGDALAGWGKDMVANKAKGIKATVEFRFSKRQDDAQTAFEVGIFKYTVKDKAGVSTPRYRRLEALLVKSSGKWLILMERQLEATDEAGWNAVP